MSGLWLPLGRGPPVVTQGELCSRSADGEWLCVLAMSGKHGTTTSASFCHWKKSMFSVSFWIDVAESVEELTDVSVVFWLATGTVPMTFSCLPRARIVLWHSARAVAAISVSSLSCFFQWNKASKIGFRELFLQQLQKNSKVLICMFDGCRKCTFLDLMSSSSDVEWPANSTSIAWEPPEWSLLLVFLQHGDHNDHLHEATWWINFMATKF